MVQRTVEIRSIAQECGREVATDEPRPASNDDVQTSGLLRFESSRYTTHDEMFMKSYKTT